MVQHDGCKPKVQFASGHRGRSGQGDRTGQYPQEERGTEEGEQCDGPFPMLFHARPKGQGSDGVRVQQGKQVRTGILSVGELEPCAARLGVAPLHDVPPNDPESGVDIGILDLGNEGFHHLGSKQNVIGGGHQQGIRSRGGPGDAH
jgi:hypothetical protein